MIDDAAAEQWRARGRYAVKRGNALSLVLTNNPEIDPYIRQGYAEAVAEAQQPKPPPKRDPFARDLLGERLKPPGRR